MSTRLNELAFRTTRYKRSLLFFTTLLSMIEHICYNALRTVAMTSEEGTACHYAFASLVGCVPAGQRHARNERFAQSLAVASSQMGAV